MLAAASLPLSAEPHAGQNRPRLTSMPQLGQLGVIDSLTPHESVVRDHGGNWHALRIRPYVTLDGKIDGASIVLLDLDSIKRQLASVGR